VRGGRPPLHLSRRGDRRLEPAGDLDGATNGNVAGGSNGPETFRRLKNLDAQADDQSSVNADTEQLGNTLTAIGDVGRCNTATPAPATPINAGDRCPRANSTTVPDGLPEFVASAPGADLPLDDPDPSFANAGVAYLIDGASGAVLYTYLHPERQSGATFGSQLGSHEPAAGDLGSTALPDVYLPAPGQNTPAATAAGRGYVMNGNFRTGSASVLLARLEDPTPLKGGNFGGGSAGVGDLVGGPTTPVNELLVGVEGFTSSPSSDVHFFNPATEKVLQTVPDPDAQAGSAFGGAIVPVGDLNDDTFLDFAVGAENYTGAAGNQEGRAYIFRSDNSPAPPAPTPAPTPSGPPPPAGPAGPLGPQGPPGLTGGAYTMAAAGRALELTASPAKLRRGRRGRLRGVLEAFANAGGCARGQRVVIQRRTGRAPVYRTLKRVKTNRRGGFTLTVRPRRTTTYRARVGQTPTCLGAISNRERVKVTKPRR